MALLAVLMVSRVRCTSFKNVGPKSNKPFIILPLLSLLVAGIWFYSHWVLLVIALAYVSHGPLLKVWGLLGRFRPSRQGLKNRPLKPASDNGSGSWVKMKNFVERCDL